VGVTDTNGDNSVVLALICAVAEIFSELLPALQF
jgi:hypothetical protein